MSKFRTENAKETQCTRSEYLHDDTGAAMAATLDYFSNTNKPITRISEDVRKISTKTQQKMYLRWLLSRERRICVVDVCKALLQLDETANLLKEEIESELVVHVAVDLLQEFLKAGLDFPEFLHCPSITSSMTSSRNSNCVETLWDCMVFRSLLYGKSGLRYERRPDSSERFAYVIIVAMIQACNFEAHSLEALANMIYKYPIHPVDVYTYGKVFRALVVAGIGPSECFVSEMEGKEASSVPGYYEPYNKWYTNYTAQVPSLKHCARLAVRKSSKVNMERAVSRLEIPQGVAEFILLRDAITLSVINVDDVD